MGKAVSDITIECWAGTRIDNAIIEGILISKSLQDSVNLKFNHLVLKIRPESTFDEVMKDFQEQLNV